MNLIAILICIFVQRVVNFGNLRDTKWLEQGLEKFKPHLIKFNPWLSLALIIVPFLLVLAILNFLVVGHLYGLAHLLLILVVLFICLDGRDLKGPLANYFVEAQNANPQKMLSLLGDFGLYVTADTKESISRAVTQSIFMQSFESLFAPLFWFCVFDIYGIAFYYLVNTIRKVASRTDAQYAELAKTAAFLQMICDFVPMRILALTYALAGHFVSGFSYCYKKVLSWLHDTNDFVVNTALASLEVDIASSQASDLKENSAALSLVTRTLFIWLGALVLFTLGGWLT